MRRLQERRSAPTEPVSVRAAGDQPAPARPRRSRPAVASRILATGAALTATGAMVAVMAYDRGAEAPPTFVATSPPTVSVPSAPAAAPPVVIVIRRHSSAGQGSVDATVAGSTGDPAPAPTPARDRTAAAPSTRSGGS